MNKVSITVLSEKNQRKAEAEADAGREVFARPSGRGYRVFGVERNLIHLAKAQGGIDENTLKVDFTE